MINAEERSQYATTTGMDHLAAEPKQGGPSKPILKCVCGWKNCRTYQRGFRDLQHPWLDGTVRLKIVQNDPDAVVLKNALDRALKVPEEKRVDWKPGKRTGEEFVKYVIAYHHFTEKHLKKYLEDPKTFSFTKPLTIHGAKRYIYAIDPNDTVIREGDTEPMYLQVPNVTREHVKAVFTKLREESTETGAAEGKTPPKEDPKSSQKNVKYEQESRLKAKEKENQRLKEQLESMQGQLSFLHDMVKKLQDEHFTTRSTRSGSERRQKRGGKAPVGQQRTVSAASRQSGVPHEIQLGEEEDGESGWNENTEEEWSEAVDETGDDTIDDETTVATYKMVSKSGRVERRGSMGSHTTRASMASRGSYLSRTSRATSIVSASKSVKSLPRELDPELDEDDRSLEAEEDEAFDNRSVTSTRTGRSGASGDCGPGRRKQSMSPNDHKRRAHGNGSVHSGRHRNSRQAARRQSIGTASVGSNKSLPRNSDHLSTAAGTYQVTALVVTDPYGEQGTYTGSISNSTGMPHGYGRLEYDRAGRWYEGDWKHGRWTGQGRLSNGDGDYYEGGLKNDHKHGLGVMKFADGRTFEGEYINGQMIEGKMTYQDGSTYSGSWVDGMRHGRGRCVFTDESVYEGEFREGEFFGYGKMAWSDGGWYEGEWWNGEMHGQGKEMRPDRTLRHEGEWSKGQPIRK